MLGVVPLRCTAFYWTLKNANVYRNRGTPCNDDGHARPSRRHAVYHGVLTAMRQAYEELASFERELKLAMYGAIHMPWLQVPPDAPLLACIQRWRATTMLS